MIQAAIREYFESARRRLRGEGLVIAHVFGESTSIGNGSWRRDELNI